MKDNFYHLGFGTTWIGKHWPRNKEYLYPSDSEVHNYFDYVFENIKDRKLLIDTAREYGNAETRLGKYFESNPVSFSRAVICSKFGGSLKRQLLKEKNNGFRITVEDMVDDFCSSLDKLGRIDIYYSHLINDVNIKQAITFLRKGEYLAILDYWKKIEYGGLKYIGASISNVDILKILVKEKLYTRLDIIQIPSWMLIKYGLLLKKLKEDGKYIVVNSPVRFNMDNQKEDFDVNSCYTNIWDNSCVDVVLTGSRNHYQDVISLSSII